MADEWLKLPDVASRLTCDVPAAAELPAVNNTRTTPGPAALKEAVTPLGSPEGDSVTLPVNPFSGVKEIAVAPCAPSTICKLAGASPIAKSGGDVTVTVIVTDAFRLPEVPVIVNCDAFNAVELATVSVRVLVAAVLDGLNDALTPVGSPVAVKATVPPNPACGFTVMVAVPTPPGATLILETEEESWKLGGGATVRAMVACAEREPDLAVTVTVEEPTGAVADAVSFSVLVELMLAGLNVAVTPEGSPLIVWAAAPVKPFSGVKDIVVLADAPCVTLSLAGEAPKVKLGGAFTVRLMVTEVDDAPEVPTTLNVLVPRAAPDATANVATLVVAVVAGLNEAVTPAGRPEVLSVTLPLKPVLSLTVMVLVPLAP
jgi:hypothetical protein